MTIRCGVWTDEKTELGQFEFAGLPRPEDTISIPNEAGDDYRHFRVDSVTHRAASPAHPSATYLFVSKGKLMA